MSELVVGEGLTIRELVEKSDLQLEVVAGRRGMDQVIEAVYIGDLEDPTPWMVQGSLLLTTQPRLEADNESGARLVRLLKENRMVGVGVAIMPHVRMIPSVMREAADEVGLPLLRVPEGTPFRQITSYVFNALASRDMHRLRRSVALQKHLLETLLAEQTPDKLVKRLGELLEADIVLLDGQGVPASGTPPVSPDSERLIAEAWTEYQKVLRAGIPRSVIVDVRGCQIAFREIRVHGRTEQVVMAIYPEGSLISEFADAALSFAQRLLEVELVTGKSAEMVRRRTRAGLLKMLMEGHGPSTELAERLLYHGIEPREPWRLMALSVLPGESSDARARRPEIDSGLAEALTDELLSTVDHLFEESGVPFVSTAVRSEVLVLSPLGGDVTAEKTRAFILELLKDVQTRLRACRVVAGVSGSCCGLDRLTHAAGQARLALDHCSAVGGTTMLLFDELGARYKAMDSLPDDVLHELSEEVVGRLARADERHGTVLLPTLEAFLDASFSVADTAARLFIHPNTLRKRLARIESLTDLDLATSGGKAEAYLSVRAAEVLAIRKR